MELSEDEKQALKYLKEQGAECDIEDIYITEVFVEKYSACCKTVITIEHFDPLEKKENRRRK